MKILDLIHKEVMLFCKNMQLITQTIMFFLMFIMFFPMSMPHNLNLLTQIAPGIFWISVLLVYFLSSLYLFHQDYCDGVIEQWVVGGEYLPLLFGIKIAVHGVLLTLIISLLFPIFGIVFYINFHAMLLCYLGFLCGAPALFFMAAFTCATSASIEQRGFLMLILFFPMVIPIIIFGGAEFYNAIAGGPVSGLMSILLFLSLISCAFLPIATASIARVILIDR